MRPLPPAVEDFVVFLSDTRPGTSVHAEAPFHEGKAWWLDVDSLPVVYDEVQGFGLFRPEGDTPHRWLGRARDAAQAVARQLPVRP